MVMMNYNSDRNARRKRFINYVEESTTSYNYQTNVYNQQQLHKNSSDAINRLRHKYIMDNMDYNFENKIEEIEDKLADSRRKLAENDNRTGQDLIGDWLKNEGSRRGYPHYSSSRTSMEKLDDEHIMVSIMQAQLRKARGNALRRLGSDKEIKDVFKQASRRLEKAEYNKKHRANLIKLAREDIQTINDIANAADSVREASESRARLQAISKNAWGGWQKPDPSLLQPATRSAAELLKANLKKHHEQ